MAYSEKLAERIRAALGDRSDVVERKMFGGIAFMVRGSMASAVAALYRWRWSQLMPWPRKDLMRDDGEVARLEQALAVHDLNQFAV